MANCDAFNDPGKSAGASSDQMESTVRIQMLDSKTLEWFYPFLWMDIALVKNFQHHTHKQSYGTSQFSSDTYPEFNKYFIASWHVVDLGQICCRSNLVLGFLNAPKHRVITSLDASRPTHGITWQSD